MPAPRNEISSSVETLRAARSRSRVYTSCSGLPGGRASGRPRRTASGTASNSSSIEPTPMAASISRRSASVAEVYRLIALGEGGLVGGRIHQLLHLVYVRKADLDHPSAAVGILVDLLGRVGERLVDLDDLARQWRDDVRDRLHGLDLGVGLVLGDLGADRRRVEEHDLPELLLGVPGDPERRRVALDARPVVLRVVLEVRRI